MPVLGHELSAIARRRHAVLTLADATSVGATDQHLRRAAERGELERTHPGIYRIAGAPRTARQRLLLAVLAGGTGALASHRSAAVLHHLDGSTWGVPEIVTPRHLRSQVGTVRCHESTDLHLADPTVIDGIPCTGVVRTLVDLGAVVRPERLQQAIDDAIRRRLCTWEDLLHGLARHSRRGRRGVGPLRAILEECYGGVVPDSRFNRLVERLLVDSGMPPVVEHEVVTAAGRFVARLDLAFPDRRVGLELDSRRHHLTAAAFEADRPRQNELELLGWTVLRYTWRHYLQTPGRIVSDVDAALRRSELA
jgi:hypothetical protein